MNIKASPKTMRNFLPLLLLGSIGLLLLLGAVNLFLFKNNKTALEKMLVGAASNTPMFYLNRFIFPQNIEIPFASTHIDKYLESVSLFPPTLEIIKADNKNLNGSDSVIIQYKGNNDRNIFKCDGTPLNPYETSQSLYFINAQGDLSCAEVINAQPNFDNAQVIVENIDAMRILYGIDTDNDKTTNLYTSANTSDFSFDKLITMKVYLLLRTYEENKEYSPAYYTLDGMEVGPYNDGYVRKIITMLLPIKRTEPTLPNEEKAS